MYPNAMSSLDAISHGPEPRVTPGGNHEVESFRGKDVGERLADS